MLLFCPSNIKLQRLYINTYDYFNMSNSELVKLFKKTQVTLGAQSTEDWRQQPSCKYCLQLTHSDETGFKCALGKRVFSDPAEVSQGLCEYHVTDESEITRLLTIFRAPAKFQGILALLRAYERSQIELSPRTKKLQGK